MIRVASARVPRFTHAMRVIHCPTVATGSFLETFTDLWDDSRN